MRKQFCSFFGFSPLHIFFSLFIFFLVSLLPPKFLPVKFLVDFFVTLLRAQNRQIVIESGIKFFFISGLWWKVLWILFAFFSFKLIHVFSSLERKTETFVCLFTVIIVIVSCVIIFLPKIFARFYFCSFALKKNAAVQLSREELLTW